MMGYVDDRHWREGLMGREEEWLSVTAAERTTAYLCDGAGRREMHGDGKYICGGPRPEIRLGA